MAELYEIFTSWKNGDISKAEYDKAVAEIVARLNKGNEVAK